MFTLLDVVFDDELLLRIVVTLTDGAGIIWRPINPFEAEYLLEAIQRGEYWSTDRIDSAYVEILCPNHGWSRLDDHQGCSLCYVHELELRGAPIAELAHAD